MNKNVVFNNFLWRFAERSGAQFVSFIVSIVLARILAPEDYGTIALVTVFTSIMQVFVDSGLGSALIQKKDADDIDFSSVFYFNILLCIALYLLMFFLAPYISLFYEKNNLVLIIRVISITIILSGLKGVQQAYVSRNMLFKNFFYATLGGTIISALIGIAMAYTGFGVWAIVAQQLSNTFIDTVILWITVKWRPKLKFSFFRLCGLLSYGWKLLLSALLDTLYNNLRELLIGKYYSSSDLAYYNQGDKFPKLIVTNINTSIDSVLLPVMSNSQDEKTKVKNMTRRSIMVSSYIMAPLMIGLFVCADKIISMILTDKWLPSLFYLRIFCITYLLWPIHTANLNAIKAMGRSDLFLKMEVLKKIIGMLLLIVSTFINVRAMAISLLVSSIISMFINAWPNSRLLDYNFIEQIKDIFPSILLATGMGTVVYLIDFLPLPALLLLLIQVISGGMIYLFGSSLFKLEPYTYLIEIIKPMIRKRR